MKLALAVILSLAFTPVAAQDFEIGKAAYYAGDYATALQEWTPLAEAGDADAQYNLGLMYSNGQGVLQNYNEAVRLLQLAAKQDYADAQVMLGLMYTQGAGGLLQNYNEAVRLLQLAAKQGDVDAQVILGGLHGEMGYGLQSNIFAHMWLNIATTTFANGQEPTILESLELTDIIKERDKAAVEMTQAEVLEAHSMARECLSSDYTDCGF